VLWIENQAPIDLNNQIVRSNDLATLKLGVATGVTDYGAIIALSGGGINRASHLLIPLPGIGQSPGHSSRVSTIVLDNTRGVQVSGAFDHDAPTYVITHGWQPGGDYTSEGWDFSDQLMPEFQSKVGDAILERLAGEESVSKANLLFFEWEGAYTAGEFAKWDGKWIWQGSADARPNAEYAGVLLGRALADKFGGDYSQDIHFIGHSFGTIVNATATRFLEKRLGTGEIQFTTLDAPTDPPADGFAPNFDREWFAYNLSSNVDYFDNYYGRVGLFPPDVEAYGEDLYQASINFQVNDASHTEVGQDFYPNVITSGKYDFKIPLSPFDDDPPSDWITPLLASYNSRPGAQRFEVGVGGKVVILSDEFIAAVGQPFRVEKLPGELYTTYAFVGTLFAEQSPVSAFQILEIPTGAQWLTFDWMVEEGGDGDWMTVHFGDDLLWTMSIDEAFAGVLLDAVIDISKYAGTTDALFFSLNSVGEKNAKFYFGNLALRGNFSPVPLPASLWLFAAGILGIFAKSRGKQVARLH